MGLYYKMLSLHPHVLDINKSFEKENMLCCKNQTLSLKNACKLHMALKKLNFQSSGRKVAPVWVGLDLATFPVWTLKF